MDVVASFTDRSRRKLSNGHVVAQLLEPRRSCCGPAADAPAAPRRASAADASSSPQRRLVPFSWESSPGVPKNAAVPPPKPPPGRCGRGGAACHENTTTDDASSDDGDGDDTLSDALDRTSSSDRGLAALSARLSAIDGAAGSRRSPSFIMDRFLPAANAIATTSADKHPRRRSSPRRTVRRSRSNSKDDDEEAAARARARSALAREHSKQSSPRQSKDDAAAVAQVALRQPHVNEEEEQGGDETPPSSARACGLMFFFPWRAKPMLLSFPLPAARSMTSNASVASIAAAPSPSPPRRSVTLGDVLEKERKLRDGGELSSRRCWHEERSGGGKDNKDGSASLRWGTALLGTSKRYCADAARKALGRLARSATDGGGDGPRLLRRERSSGGKQAALVTRSVSGKMPPLSPPSESWLSRARRSNAASNKR